MPDELNQVQEEENLFDVVEEEPEAKAEETRRNLVEKLNAWKDAFEKSKGNQ